VAETAGHIVYPLPTAPVKNGALDMKALADSLDPAPGAANVRKGFRPILMDGGNIADNTQPVVGPIRVRIIHFSTTTNATGQFNVDPAYGNFNSLLFATVFNNGGSSLNYALTGTQTTQALTMVCLNPATGTFLANRAIDIFVLILGA
jgi:hypothetical protein